MTVVNRRIMIYLSLFACAGLVSGASIVAPYKVRQAEDIVMNPEPVPLVLHGQDNVVIDGEANVIEDDANSLEPFLEKLLRLRSGADEVVSIVHLGDSHVQAGVWDARLRELFQGDFGDAGRGLIVPHKLAGGNEPRDYAITTSNKLVSGKATSRGLVEELGFTGVAVGLESTQPAVSLWSKSPFSSVTVFHHPKAPGFTQPDSLSIGSCCTFGNTERSTRVDLSESVENLTLTGTLEEEFNNPTIYGFSLENGAPGILYHAVGVNSAAFEHFERNTDFIGGGAHVLNPDLIIISLGTNNCFGTNYRSSVFRETAEKFIVEIRENYPGTAILLTTPMEGCRRTRGTYVVNKNVGDVDKVLSEIARDNGIACWSLYRAAGGENSSRVWHSRKLMQNDRLHMTEAGYVLQGEMLYDAFADTYNGFLLRLFPEVDEDGGTTEDAAPVEAAGIGGSIIAAENAKTQNG